MKNLTPHSLTIYCLDGFDPLVVPSDGVARVSTITTEETPIVVGNVTIPVRRVSFGEIVGLPPEGEDVLIVSAVVKAALPERRDLYTPGELVRDEKGNVIGCKGLYK